MDVLDKALEPFLLAGKDLTADPLDNNEITADTLSRIQHVRKQLLTPELGNKATRYIAPILDEINKTPAWLASCHPRIRTDGTGAGSMATGFDGIAVRESG